MVKRKKYKYAGMTLKIMPGVTYLGKDLYGEGYNVEDWFSNVMGCSWKFAKGNPTAILYALRHAREGKPENLFSDDVLYGKIGGMGFALHVDEVVEPEQKERANET